ncbi:Dus1p [Angomonas deanei]|nr:Dus1p [Angomonas deanei]|eukprot:EPY31997.1 Dus1p [Angomonas deanei]
MAYNQTLLDEYRQILADHKKNGDAVFPFASFPSCPYCNGERDATVKYTHPSTKPARPSDFYKHVLVEKYKSIQPRSALRNMNPPPHKTKDKLFVVGPMVDQSELPFRLLCKYYGSNLTYTPMLHARLYTETAKYRQDFLQLSNVQSELIPLLEDTSCDGVDEKEKVVDRPVIVQFCANEADVLLEAARGAVYGESYYRDPSHREGVTLGEERYYHCDAIDLNLGCPQGIAKRGQYGSFLMEHWASIHTLIHTLAVELPVPVTVKMRVFDTPTNHKDEEITYDEELSIAYAKMIQAAGAQLLTVHGRIRSQKGQFSGLADMQLVGKIAFALNESYFTTKDEAQFFPIVSNGNVLCYKDIWDHLSAYDGMISSHDGMPVVVGHMCAEPLLWDPKLFSYNQKEEKGVPSGRTEILADKEIRLSAIQTAEDYIFFCKTCCVPREQHWSCHKGRKAQSKEESSTLPPGENLFTMSQKLSLTELSRIPFSFSDLGMVKPHLFKMLFHSYELHTDLRDFMGNFDTIVKERYAKSEIPDECQHNNALSTLHYYLFQVSQMETHLAELRAREERWTDDGASPRLNKEKKKKKKEEETGVNFFDDNDDDVEGGLMFF